MLKPPLPLHVKSDYSFGRAVGTPAELAELAAARGVAAMALTDSATLAGQMEFHEACRAHGIRAITGVELPVESPGSPADQGRVVVVLARDGSGYRSLCRLVSEWHRTRRDGVGLLQAESSPEHLFVLTDEPDAARALLARGFDRSGLGLLLVRPSDSVARERAVLLAGASLELRVLADVDAVMPRAGDAPLLSLATSVHARIGKRRPYAVIARSLETPPALFADVPELVQNTYDVAAACALDLTAVRAPFDAQAVEHSASLESRCARWIVPTAAHAARLRRELAVIAELGLAGYFLAVADVAGEARRRGISATARGSAVSSLVVHALGLSPVDPVAQGLYFERFVRASRRTPPDIDLDVASNRRAELIDWTRARFGPSHVAPVGSYQTFQRRSAYRDALAALGMPAADVDRFAEELPDDELGLPPPIDVLPERYRRQTALIERLVGRPRHLSTHPSALALSNGPLVDSTPLVPAPKGVLVTQLDGHGLSRLGLLKVDLLGSRALSELDEIARNSGTSALSAPPNDTRTFSAVGRADTVACHQLESPLVRSVLRRMPVERHEDILAAVALVRPGPASGASKDVFLRRARGDEPPAFGDPRLKDLLAPTHGVLLYEENVIAVIERVVGCSAEEADELRAAVVRGEDVSRTFCERAVGNGFAPAVARALSADVARFAAYSFSKAHAASVAHVAYQTAYAKVHFTTAFGCAVLNHHGGLYPLRTVAADLVRSGVELGAPDVNESEMQSVLRAGAVRVGIDKVRHVNEKTKLGLLEERARGGPFHALAELTARVPMLARELEALLLSGACDRLAPLSPGAYPFAHEAMLGAEPRAPRASARPERLALYRALVRANNELRFLGMHPTNHPMALLRPEAQRAGCVTTLEAAAHAGRRIRLAVVVAAMRRVRTASGEIMQFVTLEDERALLEAVVSPAVYARLGDPIKSPGPHLVEGSVELDAGAPTLRIDSVEPFHRRQRPYAA